MIRIGDDKLVFRKDIIGIFRCDSVTDNSLPQTGENVTPPPFKSFVVVKEGTCEKVYFTSYTSRTLKARLAKKNIDL